MADAASPPWVLVSGGFHQRGGMDKANAALARYLIRQRVPVHLVGHCMDPEFSGHPEVRTHIVPRPIRSYFLGEEILGRRGRAVARAVTQKNPAARVVINGGNCPWPDINWVHCVHHAWPVAEQGAGTLARIRRSVIRAQARRRERNALTVARLVIANSQQTRRQILEHFRLDPDRVHCVYLGSEPDWEPPSPDQRARARAWLDIPPEVPLAAFVGTLGLDNNKGFDTLWSAWQALCRQPGWDPSLVVCGDGSGLSFWRGEIRRAGLSGRVKLLGFTGRVPDVLAAADILVSPSRYDAYGLNVQEAICCGIPALATVQAGVAERYTPELADMVMPDPESVTDLVNRLLLWRGDMQGWKRRFEPLGAALRSYQWPDMAARIVSLAAHDTARTLCGSHV